LIIKACAAIEPVEKRGSSLLFAADKHRKKQKKAHLFHQIKNEKARPDGRQNY
jgi:hypothetical protein